MSKTKSAYEQMKLEFNRPSNREELEEKLGCTCVNCGSDLDIEYHHIVPLKLGGSNRLTNIVPLCYVCHKIAHGARNIRRVCRSENGGRPRAKIRSDYKQVIDDYLMGFIDRETCQNEFGFKGAQKFTDMAFFKDYLKEKQIVKYRNLLGRPKDDIHALASYILYEDGKIERYYRDGSNETVLPVNG